VIGSTYYFAYKGTEEKSRDQQSGLKKGEHESNPDCLSEKDLVPDNAVRQRYGKRVERKAKGNCNNCDEIHEMRNDGPNII
jgi:hypothetical protein